MKPPIAWFARLAALVALASLGLAAAGIAGRSHSRTINATPNLDGQWMLDPRASGQAHLTLRVELEPGSQHWRSDEVSLERLEGLGSDGLAGPGRDVAFRLRRDAGTFVCEGRVGKGRGAGVFRLELEQSFASELRRRGVGAPTPYQQAELAIGDVGLGLVDELEKRGAGFDVDDLVTMSHHGVDLDYVRGMAELGFAPRTVAELVKLRDHGVDPEFVAGMNELGYRDLSLDELLRARDHGADPDYAREMQRAGFGRMPLEALIHARDHGVDGEFITAMAEAGYGRMPLEKLIEARDHGVDEEYVAAMAKAGFGRLALAQLITARDHGVDPEYVAGMKQAGYGDADLVALIQARDHGVDPAFARRARARLGRTPSLERLIQMRDRGEIDG
jgi:hypothetical protein